MSKLSRPEILGPPHPNEKSSRQAKNECVSGISRQNALYSNLLPQSFLVSGLVVNIPLLKVRSIFSRTSLNFIRSPIGACRGNDSIIPQDSSVVVLYMNLNLRI